MEEWDALYLDVKERGVREPLKVCGPFVIDGETRRRVSIAAGLTEVPVEEVAENHIFATLREKLVLQKHLTKGQRAYLMVPLCQHLIKEAESRRLANLRRGDVAPVGITAFCAEAGISKNHFDRAREIHAIFSGDKRALKARGWENIDPAKLREEWEPRILDMEHPVGLGAALAGMAGQKATRDVPRTPNPETQLDLFVDGLETFTKVAKAWPRMKATYRPEFIQTWRKVASTWPEDLRQEMIRALAPSDSEDPDDDSKVRWDVLQRHGFTTTSDAEAVQ
jgi:hypothetical protein